MSEKTKIIISIIGFITMIGVMLFQAKVIATAAVNPRFEIIDTDEGVVVDKMIISDILATEYYLTISSTKAGNLTRQVDIEMYNSHEINDTMKIEKKVRYMVCDYGVIDIVIDTTTYWKIADSERGMEYPNDETGLLR